MKCPWCEGTGKVGNWPSEAIKYVHLVEKYLTPDKNVIEIGSGGWPVVPHALQVELTQEQFATYTNGEQRPPVQWRGNTLALPFKDNMADTVFSSHLIEDIVDQEGTLREWARVTKPGGHLVIMHPDRETWNYCIQHRGQPPNCSHRAERAEGELGEIGKKLHLSIIQDAKTNLWEFDYNILTILQKP